MKSPKIFTIYNFYYNIVTTEIKTFDAELLFYLSLQRK